MSKVNLDEIDHQILDILIDNTRIPFHRYFKTLGYFRRNSSRSCKKNGGIRYN